MKVTDAHRPRKLALVGEPPKGISAKYDAVGIAELLKGNEMIHRRAHCFELTKRCKTSSKPTMSDMNAAPLSHGQRLAARESRVAAPCYEAVLGLL